MKVILFMSLLLLQVQLLPCMSINIRPNSGANYILLSSSGVNNKAQVEVRLLGDYAKSYRIVQAIVQWPVNETGRPLDDGVLRFMAQANSMLGGVLYAGASSPVTRAPKLLYDSMGAGEPVSFYLNYFLDSENVISKGTYRGVIEYRIEDGVSLSPISIARLPFVIEVKGRNVQRPEMNRNSITLTKANGYTDFVSFKLDDAWTGSVVYFQWAGPLMSNDGKSFPCQGVLVALVPDHVQPSETDFLSVAAGETKRLPAFNAGGAYKLVFAVKEEDKLIAGRFAGSALVTFIRQGVSETVRLNVTVDVPKELDMKVEELETPAAQIVDGELVKIWRYKISVENNTASPYEVYQEVRTPFVSESGRKVDERYISYWIESDDQQEGLYAGKKQGLGQGSVVLYRSDGKGASATFIVVYELRAPVAEGIESGEYRAGLAYTVMGR